MSCNIFFESYPAAGEVIFQGDSMSTLLANSDNDRDLFPSVPRSQTSPNCALYMVKSSFVWRKVPAQILRADSAPSLDVRQKNILKKKCSKFKRQMLMKASEIHHTDQITADEQRRVIGVMLHSCV